MKYASLIVAALLMLAAAPASARMPELNVKTLCKHRDADAKMLRSTMGQSVDECVHDEEAARERLNSLWSSTEASIRSRCQSEGRSLGTTSYLDLVTCIQMKNDIKPNAKNKAAQGVR
ncbi:MAG TPA: hypothetical protein VFL62_25145 [Bradyrhizobium sp.]|uniref:hypothetical protein n=1 Tax=Bradyrhizobium sp. TaxID=376 RepID=UPI002D7FB438|nr:hypothetical protein [Bradyrhizobium sp.]HET7889531.1 hypothetical protein [Bradyrhizobium sp.]